MEITNVEYHSGDGGRWMTCKIDGRPALIPAEQRPTLVNNGCLFVKYTDGGIPPVLTIKKDDPLAQYVDEKEIKNAIQDLELLQKYFQFVAKVYTFS